MSYAVLNFISHTHTHTGRHSTTRMSVLSIRPNGQAFIDGNPVNDAQIGEFMRVLAKNEAVAAAVKENSK